MAVVYLNSTRLLYLFKVDHRIHQFLLQVLNPLHRGQVVAVHRGSVLGLTLCGPVVELLNHALNDGITHRIGVAQL